MPLQAPELDSRRFDDIYEEALRRIPRFTPEWTDYNDSDPGITLVQLFSWLTETLLFEMNQVPERNYIKFLQLMNLELRPAQPAVAHLTITASNPTNSVSVPKAAQISGQDPETGELIIFETEEGLDLIGPVLSDVQVYDGAAFNVLTDANQAQGTTYRPFGWIPQLNSALYLGFTPPDGVDLSTPSQMPQQIRFRLFLNQGVRMGRFQNAEAAKTDPVSPVNLVWEYRRYGAIDRWTRLNLFSDETVGFTQEGYISLEGPRDIMATLEGKLSGEDETRYWIRCRLASPSYPAGREPEIDMILPNTVRAQNLVTVRQEIVSESRGNPNQVFELANTPVEPGSLELIFEDDAGDYVESWIEKETLLRSGPDDPHYTLNRTTGEIQFGDGRNGRIPTADLTAIATRYRHGGGQKGNLDAGLINAPLNSRDYAATNVRPAVGGSDEQDVEELKREAPSLLRSRNRAITAEDFSALAQQVGGIARATAIPLMNPNFNFPDVQVPGTVTVVVVPENENRPPIPTDDEIAQVCRYLNRFRLLTTELYVKGPTYISVKVEVQLTGQPSAAFDTVSQLVNQALNEYLSARSWGFGQKFYPTNLYAIVRNVQDVVGIKTLSVIIDGKYYDEITKPYPVPLDGLIYGADNHEIVIMPYQDLSGMRA